MGEQVRTPQSDAIVSEFERHLNGNVNVSVPKPNSAAEHNRLQQMYTRLFGRGEQVRTPQSDAIVSEFERHLNGNVHVTVPQPNSAAEHNRLQEMYSRLFGSGRQVRTPQSDLAVSLVEQQLSGKPDYARIIENNLVSKPNSEATHNEMQRMYDEVFGATKNNSSRWGKAGLIVGGLVLAGLATWGIVSLIKKHKAEKAEEAEQAAQANQADQTDPNNNGGVPVLPGDTVKPDTIPGVPVLPGDTVVAPIPGDTTVVPGDTVVAPLPAEETEEPEKAEEAEESEKAEEAEEPEKAEDNTVTDGKYEVKKGDCFWNIAKKILTEKNGGKKPTNKEILELTRKILRDKENSEKLVGRYRDNGVVIIYAGEKYNIPVEELEKAEKKEEQAA